MKNLKKVLAGALAVIMAMSLMTGAFAADFTDAADIDKTEAAGVMDATGIMIGLPDGSFDPDGILNREQAAKMIAYLTLGTEKAEQLAAVADFADVPATNWATSYIAYCAAEGIISGYAGKFYPTDDLDGYAYGKMILVALGFDAEENGLVGDNWTTCVRKLLVANDLLTNMDDVVFSEGLTRENAAQLTLNAALWTATPDGFAVTVVATGEVMKVFEDAVDASVYCNLLNNGGSTYTWGPAAADDTLLKEVFEIQKGDIADDFGRPGNSYTLNDDAGTVLKYAAEPIATFTTAVSEKDVFAAVGAAGVAGSGCRYITMTTIREDGTTWNGSGCGPAATWQVENNVKDIMPGTGNGIVVEIYETDTANQYVMVCVREWAGEISAVIAADADAGSKRAVTVTLDQDALGHGTSFDIETEDFAFGDKVVVTLTETDGNIKLQSIKAAAAISGTVTKITKNDPNRPVFTIGGKDYSLSQQNNLTNPGTTDLALNGEGSWYVDSYNNIIAVQAAAASAWNYGWLADYDYQQKVDSNLLGDASKVAAEKFQILGVDGTVSVLDGLFTTNKTTGVVEDWQWDANTDFAAESSSYNFSDACLVRYTVNSNGLINEIQPVVDENGSSDTGVAGDTGALVATKSTAVMKKNGSDIENAYIGENTVFFAVKSIADGEYATYVGYKNIPATLTSDSTKWEYFYGVDATGATDTSKIVAVAMEVTDASAKTDANYVWFATTDKTEEVVDAGTVYTYTNVYLNGVKGELKFLDSDPTPNALTLYEYTTDVQTGYADLSDIDYGVYTPGGSTTTATVKAIESGYYVTDHSTAKVIYVDAATTYYQVDANTGAVSVVTGMPDVSRAYDIEQISVICEGNSSVEAPAEMVYFTVVPN